MHKKQTLADLLGIPEDKISFLNVPYDNTRHRLKDKTRFIFPDYLDRNIPDFDSNTARRVVLSFFNTIRSISYKDDEDKFQKLNKLLDVHEIARLNLGYARHSNNGHGPQYEALVGISSVIRTIDKKWASSGELNKYSFPKSMELLVEGFGPDAMSDLISNLIYPQLLDYTIKILTKFKVKTTYKNETVKFWNTVTTSWDKKTLLFPYVDNIPILLVPYKLLIKADKTAFPIKTSQYITVFLIENLRNSEDQANAKFASITNKNKFTNKLNSPRKPFALKYTMITEDGQKTLVQYLNNPKVTGKDPANQVKSPNE